jgi:hypothetical protein
VVQFCLQPIAAACIILHRNGIPLEFTSPA